MRENWKYERLLDACDVYQPATISTKQLVEDGEFDVFGANGKIGKYSSYNHEESEVLLTCRGATCGNINVSTPKSWINGNAMVVHPKEKNLLKNYLVYLLKTINYAEVITGSAQPQITRLSLKNVHIPVPPLTEQERIVALLDDQFAKIDALKANADQQLKAAKDLFQSALKEMLTPKEGWERIKLTKVCESITAGGDAPKGRVRDEKDENFCYPIYSNGVENEGLYGYTDDYKYNKPAITVAARGTIGAAFIRYVPFTPIVRLITLIPDSDKADIGFMYYIIKSLNIGHTGSSIPQLTVPMIKEMEFSFPSLTEQERIAARLDAISEKVKALQANYDQTINLCNDLKQALLKSIFA